MRKAWLTNDFSIRVTMGKEVGTVAKPKNFRSDSPIKVVPRIIEEQTLLLLSELKPESDDDASSSD